MKNLKTYYFLQSRRLDCTMLFETNKDNTFVYSHKNSSIQSTKLAIFDVKWTIVKPIDGDYIFKDVNDWKFLRKSVPRILRNYSKTHQLVFLSDEKELYSIELINRVVKKLKLDIIVIISMNDKFNQPNTDLFYVFKDIDSESFVVSEVGEKIGKIRVKILLII